MELLVLDFIVSVSVLSAYEDYVYLEVFSPCGWETVFYG